MSLNSDSPGNDDEAPTEQGEREADSAVRDSIEGESALFANRFEPDPSQTRKLNAQRQGNLPAPQRADDPSEPGRVIGRIEARDNKARAKRDYRESRG